MKTTFHTVNLRSAIRFLVVACLLVGLALVLPAYGQMSPEEHASHHPGQAGGAMPTAGAMPADGAGSAPAATTGSAGGMAGGMDEMMSKMLKKMAAPPPKEEYPTLMTLPDLSPEKRDEIAREADERITAGIARLSEAVDRLSKATLDDDYEGMQQATAQMHEGLAQFESGVAAKRVLAEGQPPRQVALQWFKGEMNLQPPLGVEARDGFFGLTLFHLFTMVLLIAFALAMVAMYFFKMRRAAALFGRIESDPGSPPPGSAAPLAGSAPPAASADKPAADAKGTST